MENYLLTPPKPQDLNNPSLQKIYYTDSTVYSATEPPISVAPVQ